MNLNAAECTYRAYYPSCLVFLGGLLCSTGFPYRWWSNLQPNIAEDLNHGQGRTLYHNIYPVASRGALGQEWVGQSFESKPSLRPSQALPTSRQLLRFKLYGRQFLSAYS